MNTDAISDSFPRTRAALLRAVIVLGCMLLSACVYRLNIQQGNLADAEAVGQVEVGMTPSQVKFLLGTPLVDDPFNEARWDYIYYARTGRDRPQVRHFLTVYFEDGVVSRIESQDEAPGS